MKEQTLIKVIGTVMKGADSGRMITEMARGISPLKRGQTMFDFISTFLTERSITTYALHQRAENAWATSPIMSLNVEPKLVVTYHFIEFPKTDIGYHAKDLTTEELNRDMKQLKRIVYG